MSLKAKIRNTAKQKNIPAQAILQNIEDSSEFKAMWDKYRKQFAYAADIEYNQIVAELKALLA